MNTQKKATKYYDRFSVIYDWVSSERYYHKPRMAAIEKLELKPYQTLLNIPCGTGQNFKFFNDHLKNTGQIIAIDLSKGMLAEAAKKAQKSKWKNIKLFQADATQIDENWIYVNIEQGLKFDAILCDLGLSGFPDWEKIIDNLLTLLIPGGKLVIMDWYIEKPSLRGYLIKWVGKGEVNRPIYQYLKSKVENFYLDDSFKGGDMFVTMGVK